MTANPFNGLTAPQRLTFASLCVAVIAIALWWRIGIIALCILCCVSLFKIIHSRNFGNKALSRSQKVCLWSMVAYWALYAISAVVSVNHAGGWSTAAIKLYFLVLPLLCLLADTAYLTPRRISVLFQVFSATLLLRFFLCLAAAGIALIQGTPLTEVKDWQFDPLGMHHNYLALYIDTAIAYLYTLTFRPPQSSRRRHLALISAAIVLLVAYLFFTSSRSGIVTLILLFLAALVHITFFRKRYKTALIVAILSLSLLAGLYLAVPTLFDRFVSLTHWSENHYPDDRVIAWICGLNATEGHLLFGYGSGDHMQHLAKAFEEFGYLRAVDNGYNSHCQYIETLLETGIVGLAIFLFMLLAPLVAAFNKKNRNLLAVLVVIAVASMSIFEVILNRQMGTQLISLTFCLLILSLSPSRHPSQNAAS